MSGTTSKYYDKISGKFVPGNPNNSPNITLINVPLVNSVSGTIETSDTLADITLGGVNDTSFTGGNVSASIEALLRGIYGQLAGTLTTTSTGSNGSVTVSNFPSTQTVSGTVIANAGTGTFSTLITNASLAVTGTFYPTTQPISALNLPLPNGAAVSALQPVINADGGAQSHIMNFPSSQPVSITTLPALATGANVIGAVNQNGSWVVNIGASQTIGLAAGTQTIGLVGLNTGVNTIGNVNILGGNATAVKTDGSATTQPISAVALPLMTGAATAAKQPALSVIGTPSADVLTIQNSDIRATNTVNSATLNAAYTVNVNGQGTVGFAITSLTASNAVLTVEASNDSGASWQAINAISPSTGTFSTIANLDGNYRINSGGHTNVRFRVSTVGTGTITFVSTSSAIATVIALSGPASTGDLSLKISNSFTRPANTTAYAVGQLIANSTTAASVTPIVLNTSRYNGSIAKLLRVGLSKNSTSITNTNFRVHFYGAIPTTISNGDGGVWLTSATNNYLGSVDVTMDKAFTDGANGFAAPTSGSAPILKPSIATSTAVYALIEARAAYTPVSGEIFSLIVEAVQD